MILRQLLVKSVCRCRYIMAYENVIQTVGKCGFGDSLLISTHSRVFTLFLGRPRAQFRPRVHLILEVSKSRTIRHAHTHTHTRYDSPAQVTSSSQMPLPTSHTANTVDQHPLSSFETVLSATKQIDQQNGRLLIYCALNSLFLTTLRPYDVINYFKLYT